MRQQKKYIVDFLFVLALFCGFTLSAFAVVSIGVQVYRHIVQDMNENYDTRTAIAYVTEKLRRADEGTGDGKKALELRELEGNQVIAIASEKNQEEFCNIIYYDQGFLWELFVRKEADIGGNYLEAGEKILPLQDFSIEQCRDNLYRVSMVLPNGEEKVLYLGSRFEWK